MFRVAEPSIWLDALRVPSIVGDAPPGSAIWTSTGRSLMWEPSRGTDPLQRYELGGVPVFARRIRNDPPAGGWEPAAALLRDGEECAYVWRSAQGVFIPFDPDEAVSALLTERYLTA